jgi:virginiamycin B lyase
MPQRRGIFAVAVALAASGARPDPVDIREWPIPNARFPLAPAVGPDGKVYITVRFSDRIARFDPATKEFTQWRLAPGTEPHDLLVDGQGRVWFTGSGNGSIGRLDPRTGGIKTYRVAATAYPHTR